LPTTPSARPRPDRGPRAAVPPPAAARPAPRLGVVAKPAPGGARVEKLSTRDYGRRRTTTHWVPRNFAGTGESRRTRKFVTIGRTTAVRYLLGFLPWIVFAVVSSFAWQWAALLALTVSVYFVVKNRRAGVRAEIHADRQGQ